MNYYALFYELVDDMVTRRVPFREEHLRLAREASERGELVLAGALADPVDRALLVFHVDDKSKAESFARKDPYVVKDRKSTRLNSSHLVISYAVFCLKKKNKITIKNVQHSTE